MPSAFNRAEARNQTEAKRLHQLIANLQLINNATRASNSGNWLAVVGNGLSEPNITRIQNANRARKANPANYTFPILKKQLANLANKTLILRWMYGYVPRAGANWVKKGGLLVPPHIPEWEADNFRREVAPGWRGALGRNTKSGNWRNVFTAEGLLKPTVHTARRKPSPAKRPERHLPTLKELAWKATPMSTMTNEQLRFMTQMTPMNLMMLKPKKRASPLPANNLTKYRREAAARVVGKAVKKYQKKKPSQGLAPRSPATLARQANLGIMGGRRRSPGTANNTRVTWSRNANGKINRFKTLENINMKLTNAQRNALREMSENQAKNTIRQLARQR